MKDPIATLRNIVAHHQHAKVNGTRVDVTTAQVILKVYDALSDTNKARMAALPVATMAKIAWKFIA